MPREEPKAKPLPNLFPTYDLSNGVAFAVGLDNAVVKELADVGVNIKDKDTISYSVKSPQVRLLDDATIDAIESNPNCKSELMKKPAWLVRGYVEGQRSFSSKNEKANNFKGTIKKFGSVTVDFGTGDATLKIIDNSSAKFIQIISALDLSTGNVLLSAPVAPPTTGGKIYVQKDRNDSSSKGEQIVKALSIDGFNVLNMIEKIDGPKMPKNAEVRYFNNSDKASAEKALSELKKFYSTAKLNSVVGLPAPQGQLEVWLPRVQ